MSLEENYNHLKNQLPKNIELVAVSKTYSVEKIQAVYDAGQRMFGENRVQEILEKKDQLPTDIQWHLIGHLQRNKVKSILPFVNLIQSVDSKRLIQKIQQESECLDQQTSILLQVKIATESTKYGLSLEELQVILREYSDNTFPNINIMGLMGMASFTDDEAVVEAEFQRLHSIYEKLKDTYNFSFLSMGMSSDYPMAIKCGSNMIRVGSAIFGKRN